MTSIRLHTFIQAPPHTCFDLSRDAGVHLLSTAHTRERVVAGRKEGLFELHDEVTWEAVHFGIRQRLSTRITQMDKPHFFEDIMLRGAFKSMRHEHHFRAQDTGTLMTDLFHYEVPFGIVGQLFDRICLKRHMTALLQRRNTLIKQLAETGAGHT